jgi:hypothetical protein
MAAANALFAEGGRQATLLGWSCGYSCRIAAPAPEYVARRSRPFAVSAPLAKVKVRPAAPTRAPARSPAGGGWRAGRLDGAGRTSGGE